MKKLVKYAFISVVFLGFIFNAGNAPCRDWQDLDEGEHRVFGSEKEKKYSINAFFIEREKWEAHSSLMIFWLYRYTDYPKYNSLRILPLFYSLKSKIDNREKTVIPLFFFYNRIDRQENLTVSPLYYSNVNESDNNRSILYLFWWGEEKSPTYYRSYFLSPLFYYSDYYNENSNLKGFKWITPVFYSRNESYGSGDVIISQKQNFSILYYYSSKKRSNRDIGDVTWWAPILPLTYHKTTQTGGHRNILMLLDYAWTASERDESLDRFWLAPLFFWKRGDNGYLHILPPIYFNDRSGNGEYYSHLLPVFMFSKTIREESLNAEKKPVTLYQESLFTLLYCASKTSRLNNSSELEYESRYWFPLAPVYFSGSDPADGTHRNLLWVFDWQNDKDGSLKRFFLIPFYFWGKDTYAHVLPPLFLSWKSGKEKSYITPLCYYHTEEHQIGRNEIANSSRLWVPLVPVIYSSYTDLNRTTHRNILLLFDWSKDAPGNWEHVWFFPFVFHEFKDSGYRYYIPFYFRPAGSTRESGVSFGLFHYHKWSQEENTEWSYLIHYAYNKPSSGVEISHWLPLYYHWKNKSLDFTLFLPLYFDYEETNKKRLYVNILGISKSVASGPSPVVSMGLGKNEGGWYIDTDFSWLYDVVSLATRITVKKSGDSIEDRTSNNNGILNNSKSGDEKTAEGVLLSDKSMVSRENSSYFWGFKMLFGLLAIERADTRRHFRLLPLSWLTWDEASKDQLKWIGNYLSYKSGDVEYFVLFPFYGSQRVAKSYRRGYLLNLYWDEYKAEEDMNEHTVLWPIYNIYSSPARGGWRVFPFIWHSETTSGNIQTCKTVSLLYYNKERIKTGDTAEAYKFSISPLHYYSKKEEKARTIKTWLFPIIPLVFYSSGSRMNSADNEPSKYADGKGPVYKSIINKKSFIFPFYYWSEAAKLTEPADKNENNFTLVGLPLLYYSRHEIGSFRERSFFLLGYYSYSSSEKNYTNIFGGIFSHANDNLVPSSESSLAFGLFKIWSRGGAGGSWLFPVYSFNGSNEKTNFKFLLGFFGYKNDLIKKQSDLNLLYGMIHTDLAHEQKYIYVDGSKLQAAIQKRTTWIIPVYYYQCSDGLDNATGFIEKTHLFWLWYRHYESSVGRDNLSSTFWFPVVPLFYYHSSKNYTHVNVLGIFDRMKDLNSGEGRLWLLPLFYISEDRDSGSSLYLIFWNSVNTAEGEKSFHIFPLYFSWQSPESDKKFILGLYLNSGRFYNRQNFLNLFDHSHNLKTGEENYSAFFEAIKYEISPELKKFRLFYGMLMKYSDYTNSKNYDLDLLVFMFSVKRDGNQFRHWLFPLWYYNSDSTGYSVLIPPLLTYMDDDGDSGKFQACVLGALWYRNYKPHEDFERRMLLLGVPYYKVHRRERGYESIGSLWGLLWEYETESETNFKKFSILKFLYKRVDINGEVYHQVLGVKF